jgi:hypothetical protein
VVAGLERVYSGVDGLGSCRSSSSSSSAVSLQAQAALRPLDCCVPTHPQPATVCPLTHNPPLCAHSPTTRHCVPTHPQPATVCPLTHNPPLCVHSPTTRHCHFESLHSDPSPAPRTASPGSSHLQLGMVDHEVHARGLFGTYRDAVLPGVHVIEGGQTSTGSIINWLSK